MDETTGIEKGFESSAKIFELPPLSKSHWFSNQRSMEQRPDVPQSSRPFAWLCSYPVIGAWSLVMLFVFGLTAWTWWLHGSLEASRVVTDFLMPVGVLWLFTMAIAIWFALRGMRLESGMTCLLWLMMGVMFNGTVAGQLITSVEMPRPHDDEAADPLDALIVLGGSVFVTQDGTVEVSPEGQRIVLAAQVWHAGRTGVILCSGGQAVTEDEPHSQNVRQMLESLGVPAAVIYELDGLNTTGEMQHLKQFLEQPPLELPPIRQLGLITSAFHMARALRLARDAGITELVELVPLPCCYRSGASFDFTPRIFIPRANSGHTFGMGVKEKLAGIIGR